MSWVWTNLVLDRLFMNAFNDQHPTSRRRQSIASTIVHFNFARMVASRHSIAPQGHTSAVNIGTMPHRQRYSISALRMLRRQPTFRWHTQRDRIGRSNAWSSRASPRIRKNKSHYRTLAGFELIDQFFLQLSSSTNPFSTNRPFE